MEGDADTSMDCGLSIPVEQSLNAGTRGGSPLVALFGERGEPLAQQAGGALGAVVHCRR